MTKRIVPLALLAFLFSSLGAAAQMFPARPVTIVSSTPAGALNDVLARAVGQRLSEKWGQPVVIENRPGAAYAIAAMAVARAAPDGHTLMATELGIFTSQPHLYQQDKRPYDADKDLVPITGLAEIPIAVMANPSLPAKSIAELVALAKARPGTITYGTAGPGTVPHLVALLLESLAGIKLSAVHYRGVGPALNDVMAGHINLIMMGPSIGLSNYRAGKLAILGVADTKPMPQLPEVPTMTDTVPGYLASVDFGLAAPAAMPRELVARINADVQQILRDPGFRAKVLEPQMLQPMLGTAEVFAESLAAESKKWEKVIRDANLRME
jgi:tripartite-type tricarboxylate transporter receptor subunit TctC